MGAATCSRRRASIGGDSNSSIVLHDAGCGIAQHTCPGRMEGISALTSGSDSIDQPVASLSVGQLGANNIRINHGEGVGASERHGRVGWADGDGGSRADLCMRWGQLRGVRLDKDIETCVLSSTAARE